ncbi:MAG TPA: peptide chain release factor N(5)-glutamine methyltransferase, partial [Gammaproteobacteria bacterium]|nr:peptide chain release factor N(5)-glutamine methyltransferase [Gammaproteobacteria bacterium]
MGSAWTVRGVLEWTSGHLAESGSDSGRLDAELLLAHALGVERIQLYMDPDRPLDETERTAYRELVRARARGTPVAHLLGEREFWSLPFLVTTDTLIPRPDTEVVVERALEHLPEEGETRVLDLGTGTGCIAAALAHERPNLQVDAVEASPAAAEVASKNMERLGLSDRVSVHTGSWLEPVSDSAYHLIACNPPYIPESDPHLETGDVAAEPRTALAAGAEGMDAYRALVPAAPGHLFPGGWLVLEIGWDQGQPVSDLLEEHGFEEVVVHPDYGGRDR